MHVVLLGDSIFDNATYVPGEPPVIKQLQSLLPSGSKATLLAVDGSVTTEVAGQMDRLPKESTHLVVSSGGNDALQASMIIERADNPLMTIADVQREFRSKYGRLMQALKSTSKPVVVCTIYDSVPHLEEWQRAALSIFNDVIILEASKFGFAVLDLRVLCNEIIDYSALSPIEPSSKGGMKIAKRIAHVVQTCDFKSQKTILC